MPELELSKYRYVLAQDLDNRGANAYWEYAIERGRWQVLRPMDTRLPILRQVVDNVDEKGSCVARHSNLIDGRATLTGTCVVNIHTATRDRDGRLSPIVAVFNLYDANRSDLTASLTHVIASMGRDLGAQSRDAIERFNRLLHLPAPVLFCLVFLGFIRRNR